MLLRPRVFEDTRGTFVEMYNEKAFAGIGVTARFVQDNQSFSSQRGTIRGIHLQLPPAAQAKLVRVIRGSVYDVAIDLRVGSPTYGRWKGVTLTANKAEQLFIPRGFAHAFCTLEPDVVVGYKVDDFYAPANDTGLIWNDPTLAINWPVDAADVVLSDKDMKLGRFADFVSPFKYDGK